MSHDVHLHVCFPADRNDKVAALAAEVLATLPAGADPDNLCREANWFLADLAKRTGPNPGPKGGLSLWGVVGNYTDEDRFVETLRPFWEKLIDSARGNGDGPMNFERVVVFFEHQGVEAAGAIEIYWGNDRRRTDLRVRRHDRLPFTWMTM